ncbi:leucine-rich repeat-containing protein 9 isoform X2 [Brachyistius frenatus]|uniref:leucine-rich repeat-containing protein 9 isoform X2 n=1 Tax=Brachyistius frenatus TaxID=100188 RepID=UPI0037E8DD7E
MWQSEEQKDPTDEQVVQKLCTANGVSCERITKEGSTIRSLEMFFSGFPRMVGLSFFPGLCQLTIVDQKIEHIEGLEYCPLLQELWVVQCQLTEISGLQNCLQLEKLYLYENRICEIKNLELHVNLELLWLNNNCITKIQGLNTLQKLKELNLADNNIEKIGHGLHPNASLQNLNLSGNKIRSFKELTVLSNLPCLRELVLKDRMSTPNPVCLLCNYDTHILYHMPDLQRLDNYDVSSRQVKEAAESAAMKKMMYYNMRVRTAQRNLTETQMSLIEKKKALLQLPEERIRILSHALKSLERELSMLPDSCKRPPCMLEEKPAAPPHPEEGSPKRSDSTTDVIQDPAMEQKILFKMEALRERLTLWTKRLDEVEAWYKQNLALATNRKEYVVQFLSMELESVGNIRLEEGCSTDLWFTSCCNLLLSCFSPSDYKIWGITDIKIERVIRIHNSALKLRFEDKLLRLLPGRDSVSQNYRSQLEYLFYITDPEKEETLCILEEGFKTAEQLKALGREGAIPLSNSLSVTDQCRIEYALRQASHDDSKQNANTISFRSGQVIVSKVFVGKSMPFRDGEPLDRSSYDGANSVYRNVDTKHRSAMCEASSQSIRTHPEDNTCRRQWFVFDHEFILPEYLIYFEYITEDKKQPHTLSSLCTGRDTTPPDEIILDNSTLNIEPVLKPVPKLLSLNDKILLNVARANVLCMITVLNLHGNSLRKIKEISSLLALRHLTISFNEFTRLDDICHLPKLEFLDSSYNHLVTLKGLWGLKRLKQLNVCWNKLTKARDDTAVLCKHTPALLKLDARYNPWEKPEAVRMTILARLTSLTHLDGVLVAEEEAAEAVQMAAWSKITQASLLAHARTNSDRPRSLRLLSTAHLLYRLSAAPWGPGRELDPDWTAKITTLNLDNQNISKLINLDKLVSLRWASFNDNSISKVEGLSSCLKLEELSFNNNSISTLKGLAKLHCLNKLSLDGNLLPDLDPSVLEQMPNLCFLSVENNRITSLYGIHRVRPLLELYIGSNLISTSRDIYYLKGLANLLILDLYGNPLVEKLENYRIYVVFHLSSLKALDGYAVDKSECESAKHMFKGRLTADTVAEKLGHTNYKDITYLTLQSCSIRMIDLSPAELFCNLCRVNLDHNNLTSFSGLIYLPKIKALSLNYNHIESILPRQRTQTHLTHRQILYSKVHSSGYGQQRPPKSNRDAGPTGSLETLMESLEVLHLSHNGISNMANLQLSRLTNLKALLLQGNEISQVEGLEGLHQLRELVLDKNRIKGLAKNSFTAQTVLLELHLAGNRIRELNHLNPLIMLHKLFLGMNKLQDIAELDKLKVLPSLKELSIVGNLVAQNSRHRPTVVLLLSQLQILDGVMITLEERTRAELRAADIPPSSQHPGASLLTTEVNLPGLLPLVPHNSTLRGMSISGGLQNLMHGHDILPSNVDEDFYTYKSFRHVRRTGSTLPTTGVLSDGNRVIMTFTKQQQDSRFPNGGKPPPM